jgi:hypothetical protein
MQNQKIKAIGKLAKYTIIEMPVMELENFFKKAIEDQLTLEEILTDWYDLYVNKDIILFPILNFKPQFKLMQDNIPQIYSYKINGKEEEFIILKLIDTLEIDSLKNLEELSGVGRVITDFQLTFDNYPKRYTINNDHEFFELLSDQVILNDIRLVVDKDHKLKLTGRAAEIAKKKGQL